MFQSNVAKPSRENSCFVRFNAVPVRNRRFINYAQKLFHFFRGSTGALSDLDEELESSLYSDDVNEEVREWIATTFARTTPGMRRKSLVRRHTFRSVVQAVKASLYVKR